MSLAAQPAFNKAHLINRIGALRGYTRYLELCSPCTGWRYGEIDRAQFPTCHRLLYRCPDDFSDGMGIDFRSRTNRLPRLPRDACYDIILVDSWHLYGLTKRDLKAALRWLAPGGTVVVHDCLPDKAHESTPILSPDSWFGVSFRAFTDFTLARADLEFCVVNIDYGCGILRRRKGGWLAGLIENTRRPQAQKNLRQQWRRAPVKYPAIFHLLHASRPLLNNEVELDVFLKAEEEAAAQGASAAAASPLAQAA